MHSKIAAVFFIASLACIALAFLGYVPRPVGWVGVGLCLVGNIINRSAPKN